MLLLFICLMNVIKLLLLLFAHFEAIQSYSPLHSLALFGSVTHGEKVVILIENFIFALAFYTNFIASQILNFLFP